MKIAVMQPYFFPYVGYFELIKSVDVFVFLSNVQYIRRGWVNRNRIRSNNADFQYLTIPIVKCPQQTLIKDVKVDYKEEWHKKHLLTLKHIYGKKIENSSIFNEYKEVNLSDNLNHLLQLMIIACCRHLGIKTIFNDSINFTDSLDATQRILNICRSLRATEYFNATNGRSLYSQDDFGSIKLNFMEPTKYDNKLSILDLCFGDNITSI